MTAETSRGNLLVCQIDILTLMMAVKIIPS